MKRLLAFLIVALIPALALADQTPVTILPVPYGGALTYRNIDLGATKQEVKATQGNIYGWYIYNAAATVRFFKFVYSPAASVTVGTTAPSLTIGVPALSAANVSFPDGINFRDGLTAYCVTGVADNSTSAPSTNDCQINLWYF